ncbi:MAG: ATP-binding cassette domain-containing protein [Oscillospiraceae bacterium]|nr:ATP-binding cassette domain-containing protein [Oscillospiraceae bacterium]
MRDEVLRMERVTYKADGVELLSNFNLNIFAGEIMGLLTLDSHGKTELIRLICENSTLYYGRVFFVRRLVNSHGRSFSARNNVAVIDRERRLVEDLSVADNIFVLRKGFGKFLISRQTLRRQALIFARQFGVEMDADRVAGQLSSFERCVVEVIRAKVANAKLLIVEDISNIVGATDLARFQEILRRFASDGSSVLYIGSHHEESLNVCDRIALMGGGGIISVTEKGRFNEDLIWRYRLDFSNIHSKPSNAYNANPVLSFNNVHFAALSGLTFSVEPGECVAMLDVDHSAFEDMLALTRGEAVPDAGSILLDGQGVKSYGAKHKPVEFIPDNPTKKLLFPELNYLDNLCYLLGEKKPAVWRSKRLKASIAREYAPVIGPDINALNIRSLSVDALYTLVYYRLHLAKPKLVVCLQPFFGADMVLRRHIAQLIKSLVNKNIAVLMLLTNISDSLSSVNRMIMVSGGKVLREYKDAELYQFNN